MMRSRSFMASVCINCTKKLGTLCSETREVPEAKQLLLWAYEAAAARQQHASAALRKIAQKLVEYAGFADADVSLLISAGCRHAPDVVELVAKKNLV